jgi:hypothetical protein
VLAVDKLNATEGRHDEFRGLVPCATAVVRKKHDAAACVSERLERAAGDPTDLIGEKENAGQSTRHSGILKLPVLPAVVGMPNGAAIAYGPTVLSVQESDVIQLGIAKPWMRAGLFGRCSHPQRQQ